MVVYWSLHKVFADPYCTCNNVLIHLMDMRLYLYPLLQRNAFKVLFINFYCKNTLLFEL